MKKIKNKNKAFLNRGFTIIEVIIATSIISITVFALMITAQKSIEISNRSLKESQANILLEEGAEAVKSIRDNSWVTISNLTIGSNYYLYFDTTNNVWTLNTSTNTPNGFIPAYPIDSTFSRIVVVSQVNRDTNDDIAATGTLDNGTKKITVTVSWPVPNSIISKSLDFYISDIFN